MTSKMAMVLAAWGARKLYQRLWRTRIEGVCLVTGGAGGIGYLLAEELMRRGAHAVVLWDLDKRTVDEAVAKLQQAAVDARSACKVVGYACNVADSDAVRKTAERVIAEVGDVDILINNAGIVSGKPFLQLSEDQIRRTFAVNTLAHFWTLRAFLPSMIKRDKGVVVTVSSAGGMVGTNGLSDYSASKFAVYGMDEALRLDLRRQGSRVHTLCVCPFYIDTGLFAGVKTRFPFLLPILQPRYVASAIADAIESRAHYLEIPNILSLAWITKPLPTGARDKLLDFLGITSSMDDFKGRSKL